MTPDEFRRHGHAVVDWLAHYMEQVEDYPVLAQCRPGDVRSQLPAHAPELPEPFEQILEDFERVVLPGVTHWQSPNFYAFFPANTSGPSILGELLASGLGVQGMVWQSSPSCTELEMHVLDWLVEMLQLPECFRSTSTGGGVLQDSASSAVLVAMVAAREYQAKQQRSSDDEPPSRLTAYTSTQGHSSIEKAMLVAGVGRENLRQIETDAAFAMRPDALMQAIEEDLRSGGQPFFVNATIGTTSSGAVDPLREIGAICQRYGLWLHVDAAMFGTAAICDEFRWINQGSQFAQSYCFNPHKWMLTNFDCSCLFVADRMALINTLRLVPEYLESSAGDPDSVTDYRDWQIPLGRRFRALKLWFVIRSFGAEKLRNIVRNHVVMANELAEWITASELFELAAPPSLNLICFRHLAGDEVTARIESDLNASGRVYLTGTTLNGRRALRICIGQMNTQPSHVRQTWDQIVRIGQTAMGHGDENPPTS